MTSDFDPRFDPAFQRGFTAASVTPAAEPAHVVSTVEQPAPVRPAESHPAEPRNSESRGNPWLRALWVMAAVLVVVGIAGQWIALQLLAGGASGGSVLSAYVLPGILQALSPWFLVAGLISAIAAVTIKAARWRPPGA